MTTRLERIADEITQRKYQKSVAEEMQSKDFLRKIQFTFEDVADFLNINPRKIRKLMRERKFDSRVVSTIFDYMFRHKSGLDPLITNFRMLVSTVENLKLLNRATKESKRSIVERLVIAELYKLQGKEIPKPREIKRRRVWGKKTGKKT